MEKDHQKIYDDASMQERAAARGCGIHSPGTDFSAFVGSYASDDSDDSETRKASKAPGMPGKGILKSSSSFSRTSEAAEGHVACVVAASAGSRAAVVDQSDSSLPKSEQVFGREKMTHDEASEKKNREMLVEVTGMSNSRAKQLLLQYDGHLLRALNAAFEAPADKKLLGGGGSSSSAAAVQVEDSSSALLNRSAEPGRGLGPALCKAGPNEPVSSSRRTPEASSRRTRGAGTKQSAAQKLPSEELAVVTELAPNQPTEEAVVPLVSTTPSMPEGVISSPREGVISSPRGNGVVETTGAEVEEPWNPVLEPWAEGDELTVAEEEPWTLEGDDLATASGKPALSDAVLATTSEKKAAKDAVLATTSGKPVVIDDAALATTSEIMVVNDAVLATTSEKPVVDDAVLATTPEPEEPVVVNVDAGVVLATTPEKRVNVDGVVRGKMADLVGAAGEAVTARTKLAAPAPPRAGRKQQTGRGRSKSQPAKMQVGTREPQTRGRTIHYPSRN